MVFIIDIISTLMLSIYIKRGGSQAFPPLLFYSRLQMGVQVVLPSRKGDLRTEGFFLEVADGLRDGQFGLDAEQLLPVVADGRFGLDRLSGEGLGGAFFPRADRGLAPCRPHSLLLARCAFAYLLLLAMEFAFELEDFFL